MARPRNPDALKPLEVGFSKKALHYIDMLVKKEGFGTNRPEVVRQLVWKEINRLIEVHRLDEIE